MAIIAPQKGEVRYPQHAIAARQAPRQRRPTSFSPQPPRQRHQRTLRGGGSTFTFIHRPPLTTRISPSASWHSSLGQERGLDIIALTDHNSVRGYAELWREIEDLELLEFLGRLQPQEAERLNEFRRLLQAILVLPGFEFTAQFGFHILAVFPEGTSVRLMEHLLLLLGVPEDRFGSGEVGATTDVLRAYEVLAENGALVIGAHVNSTHGVAMQGLRFGGQTEIVYTQDPHLHALEVTDLCR